MNNSCSQNDLVKHRAALLLRLLPWAGILLASLAPSLMRMTVWTGGFTMMGVACLVNARGCGRLHCFLTGPLYLAGAATVLMTGSGVIEVGGGWILVVMILGTVLAYLPEWLGGQYLSTPNPERKAITVLFVVSAATLLGALPSPAEISKMTVTIDGLACPFCVHGLEKKLGGLDSIDAVSIDLETGTAALTLVEGKTPTLPAVHTAVEKAGFTTRGVTVTAIGTISIDDTSVLLDLRESEQVYFLFEQDTRADGATNRDSRTKLISLAAEGALVAVSGALRERAEGAPSLSVDTVERLETLSFGVEGVRCDNCAARLDTVLENTAGVYRTLVDVGAKRVTIESLGQAIDGQALSAAIKEAGFLATDVDVPSRSSTKSTVSHN